MPLQIAVWWFNIFFISPFFHNILSGIEIFSSCVMTEMGKKLKGSCNEVEQEIFISNHSISLEKTFGLAFKPADCFMASTTTVETTTTSPPSLCLDSELIYVKLMLCAGPVFSSLKSEKKFTSFCGCEISANTWHWIVFYLEMNFKTQIHSKITLKNYKKF